VSELATAARALDDRVRWAIRSADRARSDLAALDLSKADRLSRPLYASDLAALWDRWRVSLVELQLALSPSGEE
jgi:hypothetical protein